MRALQFASVDRTDQLLGQALGAVDRELPLLLDLPDELGLDPRWTAAAAHVREFVLRPGKRIRPTLLLLAHSVFDPEGLTDPALHRIAAATELLHTFLLVHDDVADRSELRRGGRPLHRLLGAGKLGEDLAIVAGDHLFARALEAMLQSGTPVAARAVNYTLEICRHTAAGQFLDLACAQAPLSEVTVFQTLKVASLKTARYGFVAPLVTGATLAAAPDSYIELLARAGRAAGVAFQLRDDLLGLFGEAHTTGKPAGADLSEGKRTFPVIAAYLRSDARGRDELEALWSERPSDPASLARARRLIAESGGKAATERVIERCARSAARALSQLPHTRGAALLQQTIGALQQRVA